MPQKDFLVDKSLCEMIIHVPDGLGVRIPGFHPGGPGSIPGLGAYFSENVFLLGFEPGNSDPEKRVSEKAREFQFWFLFEFVNINRAVSLE